MSTARNNITGKLMKTKPASNNYRDGYDAIFGKKSEVEIEPVKTEDPKKKKNK